MCRHSSGPGYWYMWCLPCMALWLQFVSVLKFIYISVFQRTPLNVAADKSHVDIVEYLVDHGANVNSKDESEVSTWGWWAENYGLLRVTKAWASIFTQLHGKGDVTNITLYHYIILKFPTNELFGQSPVSRTTKHMIYVVNFNRKWPSHFTQPIVCTKSCHSRTLLRTLNKTIDGLVNQ